MSGFFSGSDSRRRYPNPNMGGRHYKKKGLFGMIPGMGSFSGWKQRIWRLSELWIFKSGVSKSGLPKSGLPESGIFKSGLPKSGISESDGISAESGRRTGGVSIDRTCSRADGMPEMRRICSGGGQVLPVLRGKDGFQCLILPELREAAAGRSKILL